MTFLHGAGNFDAFAGPGNVFLSGLHGTGNDILHAGSGNDTLRGGPGNDTLIAGTGTATMSGGGGDNIFQFDHGSISKDIILDFKSGSDHIRLSGYSSTEEKYDLAHQTTFGGSTTMSLSDGTQITFSGYNHALKATDFS